MPHVQDLPFVARHARRDRSATEVKRELGLPSDRPLALVSFGGYGVSELQLKQIDCLDIVDLVMTAPASEIDSIDGPVHRVAEEDIYWRGLRYVDLVAAVDVVVTKPGYGIIADCVANRTAMLYTSRGRFVEYDVMVEQMPRFLKCEFIDLRVVSRGEVAERASEAAGETGSTRTAPHRRRGRRRTTDHRKASESTEVTEFTTKKRSKRRRTKKT